MCKIYSSTQKYSFLLMHVYAAYSNSQYLFHYHRVVVSTATLHARVRGSVPGLGGLKEIKKNSSPSTCESQYCGEPP